MAAASRRVLLADDDASFRMFSRQILKNSGWAVDEAGDGAEALRLVAEREYDAIVSDLYMPAASGIQVLAEAQLVHPRARRVLVSSRLDDESLLLAQEIAHVVFSKSAPLAELKRTLLDALGEAADEAHRTPFL